MPNVFPILNNWVSPFPILGLLGGNFHFIQFFKELLLADRGELGQTPRFAMSDLAFHCSSLSQKKDARLI